MDGGLSVVFLRNPELKSQDYFFKGDFEMSVRFGNVGQMGKIVVYGVVGRNKGYGREVGCRVWHGAELDKEVLLVGNFESRMSFRIIFSVLWGS